MFYGLVALNVKGSVFLSSTQAMFVNIKQCYLLVIMTKPDRRKMAEAKLSHYFVFSVGPNVLVNLYGHITPSTVFIQRFLVGILFILMIKDFL